MPHELAITVMQQKKIHYNTFKKRLAEKQKKKKDGQFDYDVTSIGKTADGRVEVWYDASYGEASLKVAQDCLAVLSSIMETNDQLFGVQGHAGNVLVVALDGQTDGSTGAYHYGCAFNDDSPGGSDWYEDMSFVTSLATIGLMQAEISESYMGLQNMGWGCGFSNGEGLSRLLAEQVSGGPKGALAPYTTFPSWQQSGSPDFITFTEQTDQNPVSTGCAIGYLYWMLSLGFTTQQIIRAGCPDGSLKSNYQALTGKTTAWGDFQAAVSALKDPIATDNPWPEPTGHPVPPTTLTTTTTQAPAPVGGTWAGDYSASGSFTFAGQVSVGSDAPITASKMVGLVGALVQKLLDFRK